MSQLPEVWKQSALNDIAELTSSKRIYLSDYVEKGIPFYRGKEISQLKKNEKVEDILYITKERYEEIKSKFGVPVENDILITAVGTLANTYRIPNNDKFYFKDGNLIWLKNVSENSKYIEYSLNYNKKFLLDSAIGSSQKALTIVQLKKIKLPLPPLEEQKKIADILSTVDQKIAFVEDNISQTQKLKKGLMQKLLTEGIGHTEFKDSEIGRIPESWEVVKLPEITVKITSGGTPSRAKPEYYENGTVNWIKTGELRDCYIYDSKEKITEEAVANSSAKKFPVDTLLIAMYGATIGRTAYLKVESSTNQACCAITFNPEKANTHFYWQYFLFTRETLISKGCGAGQPNISQGIIKDLFIPFPPLEEQKQIAETLSTIDQKLEVLKDKKGFFQELKKGLMQKLLTGEVRV